MLSDMKFTIWQLGKRQWGGGWSAPNWLDIPDEADMIKVSFSKLTPRLQKRLEKFLPDGIPKHVRLYDNEGESIDRFTCVFTGNYRGRNGWCRYLAMNDSPFSPQGFGQHGECRDVIDQPKYSQIGKKVRWCYLPPDVQRCILGDYIDYWEIPMPEIPAPSVSVQAG